MSEHDQFQAARERYEAFFGHTPASFDERVRLASSVGRENGVSALEAVRSAFIYDNALGARVQQLVHFAQLLVLGHDEAAALHARTAVRQGATRSDLVGVVETAMITAGVPAYAKGMHLLAELFDDSDA
ncbi:MAG: carboxymuconolactone decarboxylase family protein [Acidimicrobiales bacterium]